MCICHQCGMVTGICTATVASPEDYRQVEEYHSCPKKATKQHATNTQCPPQAKAINQGCIAVALGSPSWFYLVFDGWTVWLVVRSPNCFPSCLASFLVGVWLPSSDWSPIWLVGQRSGLLVIYLGDWSPICGAWSPF